MSCLDENQLLDLVAGELDAVRREAFERHLDGCARCTDELAALVGAVRRPRLGVGDRVGRYRLLRRLGRGGMGEVFAAQDEWLGREVAVKLLRAELQGVERDHLLHEARALAALQHPGIVRVFDVGTDDQGRCYFAMEMIAGATLRQQLRRATPWATRLRWALQIGEALAAAHDVGVIHGDVKPDNVLISPEGDAKVLDFGLARLRQAPIGGAGWAGTPAYLAPEQHAGALADERTDQFAFAATVHELGWNQPAFCGRDLAQLHAAKLRPLPLVSSSDGPRGPALHRVVARGLAPDASARWPDMHAMVAALRASASPHTRGRWLAVAVGAVALAGTSIARGPQPCDPETSLAALVQPWRAVEDSLEPAQREPARARHAQQIDAWARAYESACAAHDDDARRCLERAHAQRLAQLDALREASERDPARSAAALAELAPPTHCGEPSAAPWSDGFDQALARAQALRAAGDLVRALDAQAQAEATLGQAPAPRERTALAGERARVLGELGDPARIDAATAWFVAAERSADADAATRAAATLASWVLEQHADLDQGRTWLARAASEAQRAGSPPHLRAHVAIAEAALAWRERRGPDATRAAQQAVALARSAQDVELEALAASHLGVTLARQGRIAESIAVFDAQRSALEQRLGPAHPQLVPVLLNLGASLTTAGRHDEALSTFARARDLVEQRRGPEAPELARVEHNLAATELFREQPRRAAYHAARAVALSERSGVTLQIGALHHLGLAWVAIGRAAEAEAIAWRGAALVDEAFGAEHRFAADFLELAGDAAIARGEAGRGATLHARAFAIAQVLQPDPMRVAAMGTKVAVDRIVAGDDAGGVALLVAWLGRLEAGNPRLARGALTSLAQAYLRGGRPCAAAIYADRIVGGRDVGATTSLRAQAHAHCGVAPAHARALQQLAATQALDPDASAP